MRSLVKYLKPYAGYMILCILLLFGEAFCDLSLPGTMSKIVDIGIQQNGIEESVPRAISKQRFEHVTSMLPKDESELLNDSYIAASESLLGDFPLLFDKQGMVIKENAPIEDVRSCFINGLNIDESSKLMGSFIQDTYLELGMDISQNQQRYIINQGLVMLLFCIGLVASSIAVSFLASRTASRFACDVRRDIFSHVQEFSSKEFNKFSTASLITRNTNDVTQVQSLVLFSLRMLFYAPIMGVGGIIMAVQKSVSMSWIIVLAVILALGVALLFSSISVTRFKKVQQFVDKLNLVARENLSGMMVVRAFASQEREESRFEKANANLANTNLFVMRIMAFLTPSITIVMNIVMILAIWVGGHKIAASEMQVGEMMAFMQYGMQIIMSFLMMSMLFIIAPRAAVSGARISEVLNTPITIKDPKVCQEVSDIFCIKFDNVSFKYDEAEDYVLRNISFTAECGKTTAFIGSTGSGKSTLVNLIPRLYDVTDGSIAIGGVDIRNVKLEKLRKTIGYVPQKGILFSGDIQQNVRYGREDASMEEIESAISAAQAEEFVLNMYDGMQHTIAQGGSNVSGGQRQRLAIARALVRNAPIYIFDDSFSALDFKTDSDIRRELKGHTANSIVLIVAQRIGTIMEADKIIVLDEGKIVGMGTHKELLKACKTYLEIALSQLSEEELS